MSSQYQQVVDVFTKTLTLQDLKKISRFHLNLELDEISTNQSLSEAVGSLVNYAYRNRLMPGLLEGAKEYSSSPEIQALQWASPNRTWTHSSKDNSSMRSMDELIIELSLELRNLKETIASLKSVLVGKTGYEGVRQQSAENNQKILEVQRAIKRLEGNILEVRVVMFATLAFVIIRLIGNLGGWF